MKKVLFIFSCLILLLVMGCSSPTTPKKISVTETTREDGIIEIKAATFDDLQAYHFEDGKTYCIRANEEIMSHSICNDPDMVDNKFTDLINNAPATEVIIDKDVTKIGSHAFFDCFNLATIKVDPDNNNFSSKNGVLFDKGGLTLIAYPAGKTDAEYTIPNTVTTINENAFADCQLNSVTIPGSVKNIKNNTFMYSENLETITLNEGLETIGKDAFLNCYALKSITIPASVTSIDRVFSCCISLESISVEKSNTNYSSENGVLFDKGKTTLITYPAAKTGTSYATPNEVQTIADYAFEYCENLETITLNEVLTTIGANAFKDCRIKEITIPASVTNLESNDSYNNTFNSCLYLESIIVEEGNKNYSSDNGVLFNKGKTTLITYPAAKTDNNFNIPEGVLKIEQNAFLSNDFLASVNIPGSVTSIGSSAFFCCEKLTTINYAGTEAQWDKIEGISGADIPENCTINYNVI